MASAIIPLIKIVIITMQWTSGHAAVLAARGPPSTGERGPRFELMSVWQ
jgi:hypothetical protein